MGGPSARKKYLLILSPISFVSLLINLFRTRLNESVRGHLNGNGLTAQVDELNENFENNNENDEENILTVEVMGDMPKIVGFEEELTIQV